MVGPSQLAFMSALLFEAMETEPAQMQVFSKWIEHIIDIRKKDQHLKRGNRLYEIGRERCQYGISKEGSAITFTYPITIKCIESGEAWCS